MILSYGINCRKTRPQKTSPLHFAHSGDVHPPGYRPIDTDGSGTGNAPGSGDLPDRSQRLGQRPPPVPAAFLSGTALSSSYRVPPVKRGGHRLTIQQALKYSKDSW